MDITFKAGQVFTYAGPITKVTFLLGRTSKEIKKQDITIMAVIDGYIMARKGKTHPFVYSKAQFNEVFIKYGHYKLKTDKSDAMVLGPVDANFQNLIEAPVILSVGDKYICNRSITSELKEGKELMVDENLDLKYDGGLIITKYLRPLEFNFYFKLKTDETDKY